MMSRQWAGKSSQQSNLHDQTRVGVVLTGVVFENIALIAERSETLFSVVFDVPRQRLA